MLGQTGSWSEFLSNVKSVYGDYTRGSIQKYPQGEMIRWKSVADRTIIIAKKLPGEAGGPAFVAEAIDIKNELKFYEPYINDISRWGTETQMKICHHNLGII